MKLRTITFLDFHQWLPEFEFVFFYLIFSLVKVPYHVKFTAQTSMKYRLNQRTSWKPWFAGYRKKMFVNHSKNTFIIFSYRKNFQLPSIKLCNNLISETDSTNFWGFILDKHLIFHDHVDIICSKLAKTNGILYTVNNVFTSELLKKY